MTMTDTASYTRPAVLDAETLPSGRNLRAVLGRGKFTVKDYRVGYSVTDQQARVRLAKLVELGRVDRLDETRVLTGEDGQPRRGRPATLYRVR